MSLSNTSQRAAAASGSARARTSRAICPKCRKQSVSRVVEPLTAPLLPVGCCRLRCAKCDWTRVVETRRWEGRA